MFQIKDKIFVYLQLIIDYKHICTWSDKSVQYIKINLGP